MFRCRSELTGHLIQQHFEQLVACLFPGLVVNHAGKMHIHILFENPEGVLQRRELSYGYDLTRCESDFRAPGHTGKGDGLSVT